MDRLRAQGGQGISELIREALDALAEKRRYEAKRKIERPAASFRPVPAESLVREYTPAVGADRPRITTNVDPGTMNALDALAEQTHQTKAELVRGLIRDVVDPEGPAPTRRTIVARKTQITFFSELLITALQEAVDFDPQRHHNQPPPALRIEDDAYRDDIRSLIAELKRLNENLEAAAKSKAAPRSKRKAAPDTAAEKAAQKSAINVTKHLDTLIGKAASSFGTAIGWGAAGLVIATGGALLNQLGVPYETIIKKIPR